MHSLYQKDLKMYNILYRITLFSYFSKFHQNLPYFLKISRKLPTLVHIGKSFVQGIWLWDKPDKISMLWIPRARSEHVFIIGKCAGHNNLFCSIFEIRACVRIKGLFLKQYAFSYISYIPNKEVVPICVASLFLTFLFHSNIFFFLLFITNFVLKIVLLYVLRSFQWE